MFPNIDGQQRHIATGYGILCVGFLRNFEFAVGVLGQPHPTRAKKTRAFLGKFVLERLKTTKIAVDEVEDFAGRFVVGDRLPKLQEIQVVIEDLASSPLPGSN